MIGPLDATDGDSDLKPETIEEQHDREADPAERYLRPGVSRLHRGGGIKAPAHCPPQTVAPPSNRTSRRSGPPKSSVRPLVVPRRDFCAFMSGLLALGLPDP